MFKVNNKDTKTAPFVFIVNSEHISYLSFSVSIVNFEQVNAGWETSLSQWRSMLFVALIESFCFFFFSVDSLQLFFTF